MKHASQILVLALWVSLQSGCKTAAVYTGESFASDSPFKMKVDNEVDVSCESARRSLLGQGYLIDKASSDNVKGRKAYKSADNLNTFIEMNVVCVPEKRGSTLFANGVLSTYDLKKSSSSASVGVSALGSISLPFGQSADSLVKISEETIDDKEFYGRFFAAVTLLLGENKANDVPTEPGPAQPAPTTVPEPVAVPTVPEPAVAEPVTAQPVPTIVPEPVSTPAPAQPESEPTPAQATIAAQPEQAPVPVAPEPAQESATVPATTTATPAAVLTAPAPAIAPATTQAAPAATVSESVPVHATPENETAPQTELVSEPAPASEPVPAKTTPATKPPSFPASVLDPPY